MHKRTVYNCFILQILGIFTSKERKLVSANKNCPGFFARVEIYIKEMRSKTVTPNNEPKCHIIQILNFIKD